MFRTLPMGIGGSPRYPDRYNVQGLIGEPRCADLIWLRLREKLAHAMKRCRQSSPVARRGAPAPIWPPLAVRALSDYGHNACITFRFTLISPSTAGKMFYPHPGSRSAARPISRESRQQCLGLPQAGRVKPFSEPTIDR